MTSARIERRQQRVRAWFEGRRQVRTGGWRRTDALVRAIGCGLGLVATGMILHRLDVLLIGTPLLISALLVAPPTGTPVVRTAPRPETVDAGRAGIVSVSVAPGAGAVLTALRMPTPNTPGVGPVHLLPASDAQVRTRVAWNAWGHGIYLRPDFLVTSHDALFVYGPVVGVAAWHTVLPPIDPLRPGPLPPRAAGLVGAHRSARPGDGMELRDIRQFQSGDRLRRIDWRVSLRAAAATGGELVPGTLHVRERHAEADADLVLALDTRIDVGSDVGDWAELTHGANARPGGSLDLGVRAVSTLAATFLRHGDRVGLVDLGHPRGGVPVGSGRRQLQRVRLQLVHAAARVAGSGEPVLRASQLPPGATVLVLSPFLDDKLVELTVRLARRGRLVLAVDLLPADLAPDRGTAWGEAVLRIVRAEHRVRLAALAEHGVLITRWAGGAEVVAMLRAARRRVGARG